MDGGAWWAAFHGVSKSQIRLSDFTFTFHFHALEKEMATHSSVLAWRIPGTGKPGELLSMGLHRVRHDWSDLAAAAAAAGSSHVCESISQPRWILAKRPTGRLTSLTMRWCCPLSLDLHEAFLHTCSQEDLDFENEKYVFFYFSSRQGSVPLSLLLIWNICPQGMISGYLAWGPSTPASEAVRGQTNPAGWRMKWRKQHPIGEVMGNKASEKLGSLQGPCVPSWGAQSTIPGRWQSWEGQSAVFHPFCSWLGPSFSCLHILSHQRIFEDYKC